MTLTSAEEVSDRRDRQAQRLGSHVSNTEESEDDNDNNDAPAPLGREITSSPPSDAVDQLAQLFALDKPAAQNVDEDNGLEYEPESIPTRSSKRLKTAKRKHTTTPAPPPPAKRKNTTTPASPPPAKRQRPTTTSTLTVGGEKTLSAPSQDSMTNEDRREALYLISVNELRKMLTRSEYKRGSGPVPKKDSIVDMLAGFGTQVPDEYYERWSKGTRSIKGNPKARLEKQYATIAQVARWTLANMRVETDPVFARFMQDARRNFDEFISANAPAAKVSTGKKVAGGRQRIDLTPPDFQQGEFPCWILPVTSMWSCCISVQTPKDLVDPPAMVVKTKITLKTLELLANRDEQGLRQLRSWGGVGELSHLCHSK